MTVIAITQCFNLFIQLNHPHSSQAQRPLDGGTRSCACKQLGKEHPALQKHRLMTRSHPSARSTELLESCKPKGHYGKLEGKKKKKERNSTVPLCSANFTSSSATASSRLTFRISEEKNTKPVCVSSAFLIGLGFTLQNLSTLSETVIKLRSLLVSLRLIHSLNRECMKIHHFLNPKRK